MAVLIGERYRAELDAALEGCGIEPVYLPDNPHVDPRLAGHADLSAIVLGDKKIVLAQHLAKGGKMVSYLSNNNYTMIKAASEQTALYPGDASLCACLIGNRLIHNKKCTDKAILDNFSGEFINVNQGYSKCSTCVIGDSAIMTSDSGIARAAKSAGVDVLQIQAGYISLDGFGCGFIGGASFVLDKTVYFTGTLSEHPDRRFIEAFIAERGMSAIYLTQRPVFDIGGAIPV